MTIQQGLALHAVVKASILYAHVPTWFHDVRAHVCGLENHLGAAPTNEVLKWLSESMAADERR